MTKFGKVEMVQVGELKPYQKNSRTHSAEQIDQIAKSIKEFGFTNPILIDGARAILAGHGRKLAAEKLGITEVPCLVIDYLSDAQRRAYVIADNKLALNAGWDEDLLRLELGALSEDGFDLALTGFSDDELAALKLFDDEGSTGNIDDDEAPEEQPAISVLGDTWTMGNHRIRCGSSTDADDVAALLNGVKPHLMVTDPPYGVNYDADWRNKATRKNHELANGKVLNDDNADWSEAWALFPGDVAYVWHSDTMANVVWDSLVQTGFDIRAQIIWAKSTFAMSQGHYHHKHEPCLYVVRKNATGHWNGDRKQTTVWEIDKPMKSETGHSTQKPVECMRRPMVNNSSPGQAVYEPFSGSGTTIIAGEKEGRHVYAMELHPPYVDIAVRRWQEWTGKNATLDGDGRTFAEVAAERG